MSHKLMPAKKKKKKAAKKKDDLFTFKNRECVEYIVLFKKPHGKHFDEADGVCYSPDDKRPRIYINPYLTKQSELNTCIHEFAHAFFWDETERSVASFANALSRFLYQECSWRKIERSGKRTYKGK